MGVYDIIREWVDFRMDCVKRRISFDLARKKEKLHLLKALGKILLDIDKAIKIIRETEEEADVIPNLMIGFSIDEVQAEYIAEIKLRHLNREYIVKRLEETKQLEAEIAELTETLGSDRKIKSIIISELKDVIKKYGQPRKTQFFYKNDIEEAEPEDDAPDYQVTLFLSASGYFKKITPLSLRMASEQKFKEGDCLAREIEATNKTELLFFSDKAQVYKTRASAFEDTKASSLGDFIPAKLGFDEGENVLDMVVTTDYSGYLLFVFENGKVAKVPLNAYETKQNRKKLNNAYSAKSPLVAVFHISTTEEIMLRSSNGRAVIFDSALLLPKSTRDTQGVQVMSLKTKGSKLEKAFILSPEQADQLSKYRSKTIPVAGSFAKDIPDPDQMSML